MAIRLLEEEVTLSQRDVQRNKNMMDCRVCGKRIEPFISFGKMPIANGFLLPEQFAKEYFFELAVSFCPHCGMVQLVDQPEPERMFHDQYAFYSSTSRLMAAHFQEFARQVASQLPTGGDPFVVEIGSNDGIMLQHFARQGVRHLGIEPSQNVARVAIEKGVQTITEFFNEKLAHELVSRHGQADAFLGANVMCHIPDLHSVAEGIRILLKPKGVLMFEDPYLGDIIEKTSYDQIYDEHAYYFSVHSVGQLFKTHGMEVVDVQPQDVHGGSMRYVIAHIGEKTPSVAVGALYEKEKKQGLSLPETYAGFRSNVEHSRDELIKLLQEVRRHRKSIVGYAATSKSTTVTNYCGITPELVEYISDTTQLKQGTYSPGAHIPVRSYDVFQSRYPDYALLFGWNHSREIMAKENGFKNAGGRWILYIPRVHVL
jgi:methylation protein EvaC